MICEGPPSLDVVVLLFCDAGIGLQTLPAQCLTADKRCQHTLPIPSERLFLAQHGCHIVGGGVHGLADHLDLRGEEMEKADTTTFSDH